MALHSLAGKPVPDSLLIDVKTLIAEYYAQRPDPNDPFKLVSFGTSGHRGSSLDGTFTEQHILATTQAICDFRRKEKISGPLYLGKDTHALSGPAQRTAIEVLAANDVTVFCQQDDGYTPTPVISHAILCYNRGRSEQFADGIVVTPSHNPPRDGGFKYNPPNGGPADTDVTGWIQTRANEYIKANLSGVKRVSYESALKAANIHAVDLAAPYLEDLATVIDFEAIRASGIKLGVDPLGGAAVHYWEPLAARYKLNLTVVNPEVDPRFSFMSVDHDGKIRMDCSSPYAMAKLISLKDRYDVAFGNDPDVDRHGIVARSVGLLNPNHYLAVAVQYLFTHRPQWPAAAAIGKTLVSSGIIDRVATKIGRKLVEVPVGFKWFVSGLIDSSLGFGGEESAGASFLRRDGTVWTTDKDGIILVLLAAEMTAVTGKDPGELFAELTAEFGTPYYIRLDKPTSPEQKSAFKKLTPERVAASQLAGERITAKVTNAPGNNAPIGGLKVVAENGWFAARPSGTENIYKVYAESFKSEAHLKAIVAEAEQIVTAALGV